MLQQYRIKVQEKIQKEYDNFRKDILLRPKEEIFYLHYKIYFMEEITSVILNDDWFFEFASIDKILWFLATENVLETLYCGYLDSDSYIGSWSDNVSIIEELVEAELKDINNKLD